MHSYWVYTHPVLQVPVNDITDSDTVYTHSPLVDRVLCVFKWLKYNNFKSLKYKIIIHKQVIIAVSLLTIITTCIMYINKPLLILLLFILLTLYYLMTLLLVLTCDGHMRD